MQKGGFAVGYVSCNTTGNPTYIPYEFKINGQLIKELWSNTGNKYLLGKYYHTGWIADRDEEGEFLIIYDPADPEKHSLVRLDCPIRDSADFHRYVDTITALRRKGEAGIGKLIPGGNVERK